jgi:hypothetical protein
MNNHYSLCQIYNSKKNITEIYWEKNWTDVPPVLFISKSDPELTRVIVWPILISHVYIYIYIATTIYGLYLKKWTNQHAISCRCLMKQWCFNLNILILYIKLGNETTTTYSAVHLTTWSIGTSFLNHFLKIARLHMTHMITSFTYYNHY